MSSEEDRRWSVGGTTRVVLLTASLAVSASAQDSARITWKGDDVTRSDLAEEVPAAARAVGDWTAFARMTGSRFVLSEDGRVLLVLGSSYQASSRRKEHREVRLMLELVAQTTEVMDRVLPPPAGEVPTSVVVCVRREHYQHLLHSMTELDGRLLSWAGAARRTVSGFVLSEPSVGVWIEDPELVDEWNPYNELVHRTAQLLVRQRGSRVPGWLLLGLAWHAEDTVRGSIYCFPHRTGFVSALSHTDWGRWLRNEFRKSRRRTRGRPAVLEAAEFAGWKPSIDGVFDDAAAHVSFGVVRYLVRNHPGEVLGLVTRLSNAVEEGSRVWISETEWTTDPRFRLPVADQLAVFEQIDAAFLDEATRFFRKNGASRRVAPSGRKRW